MQALTIALAVFQALFTAAVTVTLWRLSAAQRRHEGLEAKLHETATKLIDERFRAMTHELNNHVQGFVAALDDLKERLKASESELGELDGADHAHEMRAIQRMEQIKDYVRDHTATKHDVREHEKSVGARLDKLDGKIEALVREVASMGRAVSGGRR